MMLRHAHLTCIIELIEHVVCINGGAQIRRWSPILALFCIEALRCLRLIPVIFLEK